MVAVATLFTGEQGLLGTIRFRHMPALGAGLRGVARVDRNHLATTPRLLVLQHAATRAPALIQDCLVQTCFLSDLPPWLLDSATSRPRHVADLQVLKTDDRVVFAGLGTELVQEVTAAIGDAVVLLLPILRVFDHARKASLHAGFLLLDTSIGIEGRMQTTIRERRKGGNTQVNPNLSRGRMYGLRHVHLHLEGNKPMLSLSGDGDVFDAALHLTAVPKLDPADLWQVDLAPIQLEALGIAEAIGEELLAVLRRGSSASEEVRIRTFQVNEALLQDLRVDAVQPVVFLALLPQRQQAGGIVVRQTRNSSEIPAFVDRQNLVPDKTTGTGKANELRAINMMCLLSVFVALAYLHRHIIQLVYGKYKRISYRQTLRFQAPCPPGLRHQVPQESVDWSCP